MAEARTPGLRVLEGLSLNAPGAQRREKSGADPGALAALRAARPIVDRLDLAERRRLAAVVACVAGSPEQGMLTSRLAVDALALGRCLPLHVSGLGSCGLFTALHVAQALLGRSPEALVLVVRTGAAGSDRDSAGALLLARQGGVGCRPLPPGRVALPANASAAAHDRLCGQALALAIARGGLRADDVQRVASPGVPIRPVARLMRAAGLGRGVSASLDMGMGHAVTLEAAMGAAVHTPPAARTLLWAHGPEGALGACLLEPA